MHSFAIRFLQQSILAVLLVAATAQAQEKNRSNDRPIDELLRILEKHQVLGWDTSQRP